MKRLREIFYEALMSTSRFPRWWILALVQTASLYLIGDFAQPHRLLRSWSAFWLFLAVCVMSAVTTWLWLEIEAFKSKTGQEISLKIFLEGAMATALVIASSAIIFIAAKFLYPDWLFSALLSSLISATSTLAILYIVLCGQAFDKALALALDTWNKKISLAAQIAFILLLAHGISFAAVHGVLKSFMTGGGFSISGNFATIWVLSLVLLLFTAFIAAFLNTFLVLLFLEIIARKKYPETEKAALSRLVTSQASQLYKGG